MPELNLFSIPAGASFLDVLAGAMLLSTQSVSLPVVLTIVTIVPWITVAAFELYRGADHEAQVLEGLREHDEAERTDH